MRPPARLRSALTVVTLLAGLMGAAGATAVSAAAATAVPPTPTGLPAAIEALQPYVGQSTCDPVAKPGVSAFRDLLLTTYPNTGSSGIVRDCGQGGQSEHKEGRAFDWRVSVADATEKAQADALIAWLLKTDGAGNTYAMARRLGIMYVIWNKRIWSAYGASKGWQTYTGADSHTTHVHFSFGWSGARKVTSYWDRTVASTDLGPGSAPTVTPVPALANLTTVEQYGAAVLQRGSSGEAVKVLQRALRITADGSFGGGTETAVRQFQGQQELAVDGVWQREEWTTLFPAPVTPFGLLDAVRPTPDGVLVSGWTADADTTEPITVSVHLDGTRLMGGPAGLDRPDVAALYPSVGAGHGFSLLAEGDLTVPDGTHTLCAYGINAPGSPGLNVALGCRTLTVDHRPTGALESVTSSLGTVTVTGWAVDSDTTAPVPVSVTVDGTERRAVADALRTDIGRSWPDYGDSHGLALPLQLPEGRHDVCLTALNAEGTDGSDRALGCRSVDVRHTPVGDLEAVHQVPTGIDVRGWALDPDSTGATRVDLTVDGAPLTAVTADGSRPDIAGKNPANGALHGFTALQPLAEGTRTVCATATNLSGTPGAATAKLGCRTLTVTHSPVGRLLTARVVPGGTVLTGGWALDPDDAGTTSVRLTVNGRVFKTVTAGTPRSDVAAAWPAHGSAHGWVTSLTLSGGDYTVCAVGTNRSGTPGADTTLGCQRVTVGSTFGRVAATVPGTGKVSVRGWTIDPDVSSATRVDVWVDGRKAGSGTADRSWAGLGRVWPGYGDAHAFAVTVPARAGRHTVCVHAVNVAGTKGATRRISCATVTVR